MIFSAIFRSLYHVQQKIGLKNTFLAQILSQKMPVSHYPVSPEYWKMQSAVVAWQAAPDGSSVDIVFDAVVTRGAGDIYIEDVAEERYS